MKNKVLHFGAMCLISTVAQAGVIDITGQKPEEYEQANGNALRSDNAADEDMGRVLGAFDNGHSSASDTVLYRTYDPHATVAVRLRKYMGTLISLPEGVRIKSVVLGDQEGFVMKLMGKEQPNRLTVYARQYEIDTNLIITDETGRVYTFYLRSDPRSTDYVPHFAVVVTLPGDEGIWSTTEVDWKHGQTEAPIQDFTGEGFSPEAKDSLKRQLKKLSRKEYDFLKTLEKNGEVVTGYKMYGDSTIAPNAVWDDGKQTYISFRDGTESQRIPNVYRVQNGYATLTNYHLRDGFVVVDSLSPEGWMLADGDKTICIKSPKERPVPVKPVEIKELPNAL